VWISQLKIRLMVQDDLPDLEWDGEYAHFRRMYREIYQTTLKGKSMMWVAEILDLGLIGQVFVQLDSSRPELADGATRAYIYGFRVKADYRHFGVGARLLQTVESELKRRRYRWVTLNVGRDNPDAQRFYERYGYSVAAAESGRWSYMDDQNYRHEVNEPAWRMEKRLV
jgi:ribosomal protein S18 acetylase RimI-like enzyme